MGAVVLDASALLALFNKEAGHELVEQHLPGAVISAVNAAEVMTVLTSIGMTMKEASAVLLDHLTEVIDFDYEQALLTASLRVKTRAQGLSLGDRACLALAEQRQLPVLTADKVWSKLDLSIKVVLIR